MNHFFLPLVMVPFFMGEPEEQVPLTGQVIYAPIHVIGPAAQGYIFVTDDYEPYTHHFYPEDGSVNYCEDEPIEWSS